MQETLIPEIGSVPQAFRAFRVAWVDALVRASAGEPVLQTGFVAQHSRLLHLVDVRERDELTGPMGRIPGSCSILPSEIDRVVAALDPFDPVVLYDANNERAPALAKALEDRGMRMVAFLWGGMNEWRAHGLGVTRDLPSDVDVVRRIVPVFEATRRRLTIDDVRTHVGDPRSTQRQKLASLITHGRLSCVDGRDHGALLGTPGGDGGELLLAMSALERVTGRRLGDDDVARILWARLDAFGRCAIHTDIGAANRLIAAVRAHPRAARHVDGIEDTLSWRRFWTRPPREAHDDLLELAIQPEHLGCGHLKLSLQQASDYGTRPELVSGFLRAFFRARWTGSAETEYVPLPGGHAEGAVLRVRMPESIGPFAFVPLVSPMCEGTQTFVAHPEVADAMRRLTVRLFDDTGDLPASCDDGLEAEIRELAGVQLGRTLRALASGLPIYDLWFAHDGAIRVEAEGEVG